MEVGESASFRLVLKTLVGSKKPVTITGTSDPTLRQAKEAAAEVYESRTSQLMCVVLV